MKDVGYAALKELMLTINPNCFNYFSDASDYEIDWCHYEKAKDLFKTIHEELDCAEAHAWVDANYPAPK